MDPIEPPGRPPTSAQDPAQPVDPGDSSQIFGFSRLTFQVSSGEIAERIGPFIDLDGSPIRLGLGVTRSKLGTTLYAKERMPPVIEDRETDLLLVKALMTLTPGEVLAFGNAVIGLDERGEYTILENVAGLQVKKNDRWVYPMPGRGAASVITPGTSVRFDCIEFEMPPALINSFDGAANLEIPPLPLPEGGPHEFESAADQLAARRLDTLSIHGRKILTPRGKTTLLTAQNFQGHLCTVPAELVMRVHGGKETAEVYHQNEGLVHFLSSSGEWRSLPQYVGNTMAWGSRLRIGGIGGEVIQILLGEDQPPRTVRATIVDLGRRIWDIGKSPFK